jgi:transglutaminase-like putative cysteine protease
MRLKITHQTSYSYDTPVTYGLQQVRLTPVSNGMQNVLNWDVAITGGKAELAFQDQYQNQTMMVQAEAGQTEVTFTASGEVETIDTAGIFGKIYGRAPLWHFMQPSDRTMPGKGIRKLSGILKGDNTLENLHALSREIIDQVPYGAVATTAATMAEDALAGGGGVCQDHAQIFISAARHAGIPARYVSGYLMMNDRVDQDASHAWAEAHIDGLGWVGFDVSNKISPDERYVRLAIGRDSRDASPIRGVRMGAGIEQMIVTLQVQQ